MLSGIPAQGHAAIIAKQHALAHSYITLGSPTGKEIITSDGKGVYQQYQWGFIGWSRATGAHEVHGEILNRYKKLGGPNSSLGLPTTDEDYTASQNGRINVFQHGLITYTYKSNQTNVVTGKIFTKYVSLGASASFLGTPIWDETSTPHHDGRIEIFQGGVIIVNATTGVHEVHGAIFNTYNELGATTSYLGFPTSDEMDTPSHNGRVSFFKGGKIVYIWGTAKAIAIRNTPPVVPPPVIDVLTPPNCREGDVFTVTVINGPPSKLCDIGMLGDHDAVQYQFPSAYIDKNGNATLALRMPYVLDQGISMDGRDIRVKIGTFIKTFHVTLYAGQRIGISSPTVEEGKTLDVKITGGVAESEVTIQITDDNGVAHEYGYMQTDGSGNGTYQIIIPQVLPKGSRIDGYGLRILHDGIVAERKITITEGFRIEVEAQKTREVSANFPLGIRNSTPDATVHVEWYLDDSHRASQTFHTDRNGDADIKVPTPKLITNGADKDTFKMVVTVDGQSGEFEFNMLVLKDTHNAHGAPDDPGDPQVRSTAPVPNRVNSAPGVKINIPASVGVTTQRPIEKSENVAFAAQDPVITVQDRMAHQLVILCYGSGQIYGEIDPNEKNTFYAIAGMDQVYSDINGFISSSHIVRLESGFPNSLHPMEVADSEFHLALTAINSKIVHLKSIGEEVRSVIVAGYSWGGGMAKRIVDAIHQTYTTLEVAGVAYVDAVHHGSIGHETQLPHSPISSFLNIYQSHFSVAEDGVTIGNGHVGNPGLVNVNGLAGYGQYQEIDTDTFAHSTTSHITIDNDESPIVAGFIKRVLNGWFWAHV